MFTKAKIGLTSGWVFRDVFLFSFVFSKLLPQVIYEGMVHVKQWIIRRAGQGKHWAPNKAMHTSMSCFQITAEFPISLIPLHVFYFCTTVQEKIVGWNLFTIHTKCTILGQLHVQLEDIKTFLFPNIVIHKIYWYRFTT